MLFKGKKQPEKKLKKSAIPQLFLVLGFFGAAVTAEVLNVIRQLSESYGQIGFLAYSIFIVFVAWPYVIITIMNAIDHIYEAK